MNRTVLIHYHERQGQITGAGCVVDSDHILTTRQALGRAGQQIIRNQQFFISPAHQPNRVFPTVVIRVLGDNNPATDLVLLSGSPTIATASLTKDGTPVHLTAPNQPLPKQTEKLETSQVIIPERMLMEEWEVAAMQKCYPLFQTPRAVKRLANTYCLIRVGIEGENWEKFIGNSSNLDGEYRIPMLMLAVAAAFPALAQKWFNYLDDASGWLPAKKDAKGTDFEKLALVLDEMGVNQFAPFDRERVRYWLKRVERYAF